MKLNLSKSFNKIHLLNFSYIIKSIIISNFHQSNFTCNHLSPILFLPQIFNSFEWRKIRDNFKRAKLTKYRWKKKKREKKRTKRTFRLSPTIGWFRKTGNRFASREGDNLIGAMTHFRVTRVFLVNTVFHLDRCAGWGRNNSAYVILLRNEISHFPSVKFVSTIIPIPRQRKFTRLPNFRGGTPWNENVSILRNTSVFPPRPCFGNNIRFHSSKIYFLWMKLSNFPWNRGNRRRYNNC